MNDKTVSFNQRRMNKLDKSSIADQIDEMLHYNESCDLPHKQRNALLINQLKIVHAALTKKINDKIDLPVIETI